jgi:diguanylate cyclase (GGDEF)-like protein
VGPETWLPQQLAELLAVVSHFPDERSAIEGAIERAAEAVDAEIAAVIIEGKVVSSIGFASGAQDDALLLRIRDGCTTLDVPGLGLCAALVVPVDVSEGAVMVLARSGEGFDQLEESLLRAVGRVVALVRRLLRLVESERCLRIESEEHAHENARLLSEVRDREALFERLFRIQQSISHRAPTQNVLDAITEGAAHLLSEPVAGLRLIDENDPGFIVLVSATGIDDDLLPALRRTPLGEGVGGEAIEKQRLVVADDYAHSRKPLGPFVAHGLQSAMAAPVMRDGHVVGSLAIASWDHDRRYSTAEQEVLLALAEHASLALNDASARDAMRHAFDDALHQASHDSLTGLPNRALVIDQLGHALGRATAAGDSIGVLFIDLDRFKAINDSLGHSVGDEVLVRVAERLQLAVRPNDLVGRLAGDEFVVVCEGVTPDVAAAVAERATHAIAEPLTLYGRETVITASVGISISTPSATADDMLRDADVAMYRAKERGRSRVEMFDSAMRTRVL